MLRVFAVTTLALGLSGCGGALPFDYSENGTDPKPFPTSLAVSIPPSQAMASMPSGAGQVIAVIERRRGNAIEHDITLAGAPPNFGENQINVTAFRHVDDVGESPVEDMVKMRKPTDEDIYKEMEARFPGGAMPTASAVPYNGMGTFGYAFSRRNGANCLYAWQWIEPANLRPFRPFNNKTAAPISVRVRLCRPGMTEEVLVDFVRQLVVMPRYDDSYRGYPAGRGAPMAMGGRSLGMGNLSAGGYGAQRGFGASPYGSEYPGYGPRYDQAMGYPKYQGGTRAEAPAAVAAAPRTRTRVIVKRIYVRQPAQETYSSYQAPASAPAARAAVPAATGGYSAVPMPQ